MTDIAFSGVKILAGISARNSSNEDERYEVLVKQRQSHADMLLSIDSRARVILLPDEARALAEVLTNMAQRVEEEASDQ